MSILIEPPAEELLSLFHKTAKRVTAYGTILNEKGIRSEDITTIDDFARLPILDKYKTFQRFPIHELTLDGKVLPLRSVMTSSGQSGIFSFGLYDATSEKASKQMMDQGLDAIFQVSTRSTLLLNCLPMGVHLASEHCTLGETSVRPDMACALMETFGQYHEQTIIVAETAFAKHLLEVGLQRGIDWAKSLVHMVIGGEMVAENARKYFETILDTAPGDTQRGLILCSMGSAEVGLNLFSEVPYQKSIILLRRALHEDQALRQEVLGTSTTTVPAIFTYDPETIYVEFIDGQMVTTPLDAARRVPLIRYSSGDEGGFLEIPASARDALKSAGIDYDTLSQVPLVLVRGRGDFASAGKERVYPEEVKEGIYHNAELCRFTTANFRLASGKTKATLRIQLAPGVESTRSLTNAFSKAVYHYVTCPLEITCQAYGPFGSGVGVDYERKYDYLGA